MAVSTRRARGQALAVTAGVMASNASGYLLTVVAARALAPAAFGELGALLAVLLVGAVPAMGVQTVVALRVAGHPGECRAPLIGLGLAVASVVAVLAGVAVPVIVGVLRVGDVLAVVWLACAVGPLTVNGLWHGLLQGRQRFAVFGAFVAAEAGLRVGGALVGLVISRSTTGALAGVAVGTAVSAVVGWVVCGRPRPARFPLVRLREAGHAVQALLAMVVLVNLDLVLARHVLPVSSGEYAVGAVLTKIAYWLPNAIAIMILPRLASAGARAGHHTGRGRAVVGALAVCAALDGVVVVGSVLFGSQAMRLIGGQSYVYSVLALWPFAVVGSLLSLAQILLFARIAGHDRRATLLTWLAVAVETGLVLLWLNDSPLEVVSAAVVATGLLVLAGAAVEVQIRHRRTT
ncbi:O-antigen/teichoic acid export membrane protein [Saccharothrix ecbatanensis]|uniref:O-antigen/teichoic acid export membrane protein n=1 Tax=Saccharothrix ecbatanensis TaxID=1105145 RepID=A0A7W9HIF7_9PSEU|nr:polysaccharide biosynthesis protein [Saccharothrix ecbatanensis]MBB5802745.1 O-antigen/teichoic acid export membrane protein [Saccharothrix ecbatanensis]